MATMRILSKKNVFQFNEKQMWFYIIHLIRCVTASFHTWKPWFERVGCVIKNKNKSVSSKQTIRNGESSSEDSDDSYHSSDKEVTTWNNISFSPLRNCLYYNMYTLMNRVIAWQKFVEKHYMKENEQVFRKVLKSEINKSPTITYLLLICDVCNIVLEESKVCDDITFKKIARWFKIMEMIVTPRFTASSESEIEKIINDIDNLTDQFNNMSDESETDCHPGHTCYPFFDPNSLMVYISQIIGLGYRKKSIVTEENEDYEYWSTLSGGILNDIFHDYDFLHTNDQFSYLGKIDVDDFTFRKYDKCPNVTILMRNLMVRSLKFADDSKSHCKPFLREQNGEINKFHHNCNNFWHIFQNEMDRQDKAEKQCSFQLKKQYKRNINFCPRYSIKGDLDDDTYMIGYNSLSRTAPRGRIFDCHQQEVAQEGKFVPWTQCYQKGYHLENIS